MVIRRSIRAVFAAVASLTLVAGCGASGSDSSGGGGDDGTVKIGMICGCSGTYGTTLTAASQVAQAWVNSVNDSGGVNGHKIELIIKDDGSNPGTSVTAAQSLISAHVAAIIDSTTLDQAWQKQVDAAKIPVVGGNFTTAPYYTDPNWYPTGQTNDSIVYANVATAKKSGGTKLGLLYCAESPQCQESVEATKSGAEKQGVSLVYQASIQAKAPNYTSQCLAAKEAGVDSLIILHSSSAIIHVAQDCARQNYAPAYVAEGTGFAGEIPAAEGLNQSYWAPFPILPFFASGEHVQTMNNVVDKYQPGLRQNPIAFTVVATQSWTAALAVGQAVKASAVPAGAKVTADDITRGLGTFKDETLGGWSPPLTFTPGKPHPVDCWYIGRVQGGKASLVDDGKLTCESAG